MTYVVEVTFQITVLSDSEENALADAKQAVVEGFDAVGGGRVEAENITATIEGWI